MVKYRRDADGFFRETFTIPGQFTASGNPKREWIRERDFDTFRRKVKEAQRRYGRGVDVEEQTVREWCDRWFSIYKSNSSMPMKAHFRAKISNDICPIIGDMYMSNVRASHLQEILNAYNGGNTSTIRKLKNAIEQIFSAGFDEGFYEVNPAAKLAMPKTVENKRRPLTNIEKIIVCEVAKTHKHGAYAMTMMLCGLRRGEALGLKMENVNLEKRRIRVVEALNLNEGKGKLTGPKTKAGVRMIPIPELLYPYLCEHCKDKSDNDLVFPYGNDNKYATRMASRRWWLSFMRSCHIYAGARLYRNRVLLETSPFSDEITPHYLRHTYSTDIYAAGIDEKAQGFFIGHASGKVTDIYRQMSEAAFERATAILNEYYSSSCLSPYENKRTKESIRWCLDCPNTPGGDNSFSGIDW